MLHTWLATLSEHPDPECEASCRFATQPSRLGHPAFKRIRIIFRLGKTNTLDSEAADLQQLQVTGSPLLPFPETGEPTSKQAGKNLRGLLG